MWTTNCVQSLRRHGSTLQLLSSSPISVFIVGTPSSIILIKHYVSHFFSNNQALCFTLFLKQPYNEMFLFDGKSHCCNSSIADIQSTLLLAKKYLTNRHRISILSAIQAKIFIQICSILLECTSKKRRHFCKHCVRKNFLLRHWRWHTHYILLWCNLFALKWHLITIEKLRLYRVHSVMESVM